MRPVDELNNFSGKRVLIRVDWNVPIQNNEVKDTSRIEASIKTIEYILQGGGRVIIVSHLTESGHSLVEVAKKAESFFRSKKIIFIKNPWGEEREVLDKLDNEQIAVIENIRFWEDEEKNTVDFAKKLSGLADIYINEAFSASHREHASIVGVPKLLPSFAGFHFFEEYEKLSLLFKPEHPFMLILGGAKFETKLPLVEKFIDIADDIFIGGAMAKKAVDLPLAKNKKVFFPIGDIAALDANKETLLVLEGKIDKAKMLLWNGPLGKYEDNYKEGTLELARSLSDCDAKVIVGGGDTENVIDELKISDKFFFVSLAGGAMLDFLANETLPGIEALENCPV